MQLKSNLRKRSKLHLNSNFVNSFHSNILIYLRCLPELDSTQHLTLLLSYGAELNARTAWGDTAVHYAALTGTYASLTFLVECGITMRKPTQIADEAMQIWEKLNLDEVIRHIISSMILD